MAPVSRGRMKGLLACFGKDAKGLTEMEEELVKRRQTNVCSWQASGPLNWCDVIATRGVRDCWAASLLFRNRVYCITTGSVSRIQFRELS
jgi:hypothetical protein